MNIDITQTSPELFDTQAENFAKAFKKPESAQIRRFYDELVRFEQQSRMKPQEWDNILPLVKMLNAKVAYANARKHVDDSFYTTFNSLIKQIQQPEHLRNCKLFLEATIGFKKLADKIKSDENRNSRH